jgi:hypothetical protein
LKSNYIISKIVTVDLKNICQKEHINPVKLKGKENLVTELERLAKAAEWFLNHEERRGEKS